MRRRLAATRGTIGRTASRSISGWWSRPEGLPIGYEIFAGNTADVTTVEEMVELMEEKYGQAQRIWVMDRGMISEENIEFLRERTGPLHRGHAQEPAQSL